MKKIELIELIELMEVPYNIPYPGYIGKINELVEKLNEVIEVINTELGKEK